MTLPYVCKLSLNERQQNTRSMVRNVCAFKTYIFIFQKIILIATRETNHNRDRYAYSFSDVEITGKKCKVKSVKNLQYGKKGKQSTQSISNIKVEKENMYNIYFKAEQKINFKIYHFALKNFKENGQAPYTKRLEEKSEIED